MVVVVVVVVSPPSTLWAGVWACSVDLSATSSGFSVDAIVYDLALYAVAAQTSSS